jgi:hypothetical protein
MWPRLSDSGLPAGSITAPCIPARRARIPTSFRPPTVGPHCGLKIVTHGTCTQPRLTPAFTGWTPLQRRRRRDAVPGLRPDSGSLARLHYGKTSSTTMTSGSRRFDSGLTQAGLQCGNVRAGLRLVLPPKLTPALTAAPIAACSSLGGPRTTRLTPAFHTGLHYGVPKFAHFMVAPAGCLQPSLAGLHCDSVSAVPAASTTTSLILALPAGYGLCPVKPESEDPIHGKVTVEELPQWSPARVAESAIDAVACPE